MLAYSSTVTKVYFIVRRLQRKALWKRAAEQFFADSRWHEDPLSDGLFTHRSRTTAHELKVLHA
jgi:hypothetical protein